MFLYNNLLFIFETKITKYKLSKLSGLSDSTLTEIKTKNRELKANQVYTIFKVLKELNIVDSLDDLFLNDLSKSNNMKGGN